tara:strand:- start:2949 stop:3737 length:789 start_codon:yes stop_codon:yes gene_type:complete
MISRETLIAEQLIREYVRGKLKDRLKSIHEQESQLRSVIRTLLVEAETGTEEPSTYTGINVLADLLKNIIPTIEDDYLMLTTSVEQRESFRNHLVHAVKGALRPIEVTTDAEDLGESVVYEINEDILSEDVDIVIDGDEELEDLDGEFIDIEDEKEEDDFVQIEDQNETGRNFAADTFKRVEKQIVDAYDMLADDQDRDLFYDYLITNLLLYFDKFENDLTTTLPDVTTPEYEAEKEKEDLDQVEDEAAEDAEEEFDLDLEF